MPTLNMKDYQRKWVASRKAQYLKGKTCHFCDTDEKIEIHHLDPEQKEHHCIWSWKHERIIAELKKCIYLCKPCHIKFHSILRGVQFRHGLRTTYDKYGCRCDYCRAAKRLGSHGARFKEMGFAQAKETLSRIYSLEDHQLNKILFELFNPAEPAKPTKKRTVPPKPKTEKRPVVPNTNSLIDTIGNEGANQEDVVLSYALAVEAGANISWGDVNRAIIRRWGKSGLNAIKRKAWVDARKGAA